jgi:hypothetical protein
MNIEVKESVPQGIPAADLLVGEIGIAIEPSHREYLGHIILRTYVGFVSLTDPNSTWNDKGWLTVRKLAPGTVLTMTVGGLKSIPYEEVPRFITVDDIRAQMTLRNREDIRDLLDGNKKIDAIKYVRNLTNAKLLEAKQYVDSFVDDIPF